MQKVIQIQKHTPEIILKCEIYNVFFSMNRDSRKEKRLVWRQMCQVSNAKKFKCSKAI